MRDLKSYVVITPSYNRPDELKKFIDSFLKSKSRRTKLAIYVDGGTEDNLTKYYKLKNDYYNYDEIESFMIFGYNKGVSHAREHLMDMVNGKFDYMIWVDDDQRLIPGFEDILKEKLYFDKPINYFNCHGLINESKESSLSDIINLESENTMIFNSRHYSKYHNPYHYRGEILLPEWYMYHDIAGVNGFYACSGSIVEYEPNPTDPNTLTGKTKNEDWWRVTNRLGYSKHYSKLHELIIEGELELKPEIKSKLLRWHLKQTLYNSIHELGVEETKSNLNRILKLEYLKELL